MRHGVREMNPSWKDVMVSWLLALVVVAALLV